MVLRRIFGPRRDEVTGEWRRLHNEEVNAACSPDTTPAYPHLNYNLQQTKKETTNVVINIIIASS